MNISKTNDAEVAVCVCVCTYHEVQVRVKPTHLHPFMEVKTRRRQSSVCTAEGTVKCRHLPTVGLAGSQSMHAQMATWLLFSFPVKTFLVWKPFHFVSVLKKVIKNKKSEAAVEATPHK